MKHTRTLVTAMSVLATALIGLVPPAAAFGVPPLTRAVAPAGQVEEGDGTVVNINLTDEQGDPTEILEDTPSDTVLTQELATSEFFVAGVTWSAGEQFPKGARIFLRTFEDDAWSPWLETNIEDSPASGAGLTNGTEPFITGGATAVQTRITGAGSDVPTNLALTLVPLAPSLGDELTVSELPSDPTATLEDSPVIPFDAAQPESSPAPVVGPAESPTPEDPPETQGTALGIGSGARGSTTPLGLRGARTSTDGVAIRAAASTANTPAGTVVTRAGWGADEAYTDANWGPKYFALQAAVVHHTAGTNTYTAAQSAGIVKSIFVYHSQTRGWGDIGYNFLVDKYGQIFEGRKYSLQSQAGTPAGSLVEAGHAAGFNKGTLGISAMGNFDVAGAPSTTTIVNTMAKVIAWKFDLANIDLATKSSLLSPATKATTTYPTGTALPRIFGHRDVASTACPGNLYGQLPALRTAVAALYSVDTAPVAHAGADATVAPGASVTLDGSASTSPSGALTYAWSQTSGPTVTLTGANSAKPTFVAPSTSGQLVFSLVVSAGTVKSAADTVAVTVSGSDQQNMARSAGVRVAASSEDAGAGSLAIRAIDGSTAGYPADSSKEWTTLGQLTGAWIQLDFSGTIATDRVVLYDRPNTNDQVTGGTLTFSDGTSVNVGALNNTGTATTLTFPDRTITWVRFTVSSSAPTTENIGLAEFEVWGTPAASAPAPVNPVNVAGTASPSASSQNTGTSQTAAKAIDGSAVGYPADHTKEWATIGGKANSWIQLALAQPATVNRVVLYDRPNTNDQVTGGTLTFSDGTSVNVVALNNTGTATTLTFPDRTITWVRFTVTTTSASTINVGLAEFEVWGR